MMNAIEQAVELAVRAHAGQIDEDGMPHVIHCFEVFHRVQVMLEEREVRAYPPLVYSQEDVLISALLHDVVEDTPTTLDQIEQGFGANVREIVDSVSRRIKSDGSKEFYRDFIYRAQENEGGTIIKIADLTHNFSRSVKIKKASWREKLQYKYGIALTVLNDVSSPTWERASYRVKSNGQVKQYLIADPDGKEIEIPEEEFKALIGTI